MSIKSNPRELKEVESLIEMGDILVSHMKKRDWVALDLLDPYLAAIDNLIRLLDADQIRSEASSATQLRRVLKQHDQVLFLAEKMKAQITDSLKNVRKKGKSLNAYVDGYPKRISTMKSRKG